MRKRLIAMGFVATAAVLAFAVPATAQGFGQIVFVTEPPATAAPALVKPGAADRDVDGVTVTAKRIPDSQKDPTEVLCHEELPIGSRFAKKICHTRRQYAERRQDDQLMLEKWTSLEK